MDNFREWLSDNLRYILLGLGILIILTGLFFGIRACAGNMKGDSEQETEVVSEDNKGADPSSPTKDGETDEKKENTNAMEKNAYPEINALITKYYQAMGEKDVTALRSVVDNLSPEDEVKITNAKDYIKGYQVGDIYTKKGLDEKSYVVYVCFEYLCTGVERPVPALSQIYVQTDSDGSLKICGNTEDSKEITDYMTQLLSDEDVAELKDEVNRKYEEAQKQDPQLASFLENLGEDESTESGQETDSVVTANDDCNIRQEANGESEIVGVIPSGEQAKKLGEQDGWIQVEYDGQTGYVYGDLLQ